MTRVAFFSDIHLEWRDGDIDAVRAGDLSTLIAKGVLPEAIEADLLLNGGDTHHEPEVRAAFRAALAERYGMPVVDTTGNHDWYGQPFPVDDVGVVVEAAGVRIAAATLWTRIEPRAEAVASVFNDFKKITEISTAAWNETHARQLAFLRESGADVVLTHHAPSWRSVQSRFQRDINSYFYATNVSLYGFEACKLWVHGHIHVPRDYRLGDTRVVSQPIGYEFRTQLGKATVVEL
jgi:predicted MPP superfamily phosphohydrolase